MTLKVISQGHSPVAGLFKCNPLNILQYFTRFQPTAHSRGPSARAGLLVFSRSIRNIMNVLLLLTHTHNCFAALCPGLPGWAGTRRNIHPLTSLLLIYHPISFLHLPRTIASSLLHPRTWQSLCTTSNHVTADVFVIYYFTCIPCRHLILWTEMKNLLLNCNGKNWLCWMIAVLREIYR